MSKHAVVLLLLAIIVAAETAEPDPGSAPHALSMYGDVKYPPGFPSFDYVNPAAPKGGSVRIAALGTFDTLNPFTLKGVPAAGILQTFDTLAVESADEPFSEYGLVAETIEVPDDRSWVAFTLRPQARFHDGSPVTADDVLWTFETLRTRGHPFYRSYYAAVESAEAIPPRTVRFRFRPGSNRELPLILGQLPVLSKADFQDRPFERTMLVAPLGSGPYRVESVRPGRSIVYRRVADYWAVDLPVNVGRNNLDIIRYDYYRDDTVALEAFLAGQIDFREERMAKNWATAYDVPAVASGLIRKESIPNHTPAGMQGYVYNTRRPIFSDRRLRAALAHAFDFEWTNRVLFYGAYARTTSYFANSELAATGLPRSGELAVLEPFREQVPEAVFVREYEPPRTDGFGNVRENLLAAVHLLEEAGYTFRDGRLVDPRGEPLAFEVLLADPSFERITLPFVRNLARLGIDLRVRTVDTAQYQNRLDHFDFDVTVAVWPQSLSPGNEQLDYWSSERADVPGSRNLAGIRDPVVDRLIGLVISATDRRSLVDRSRALDRVLLWGHYVIPQWYLPTFRVAYWSFFSRPKVSPPYSLAFETWWVDEERESALHRPRRNADRSESTP